jgi:hypothetical protein
MVDKWLMIHVAVDAFDRGLCGLYYRRYADTGGDDAKRKVQKTLERAV